MLGPKSLQTAPFLRKVWILMPNWVPPGGSMKSFFRFWGSLFSFWGPADPQTLPRELSGLLLDRFEVSADPQTLPRELRGVLLDRFWGVSSTNKPNNQWPNQPINKSTKQPINQSTNLQNNHQPTMILHRGTVAGRPKTSGYIYIYIYIYIAIYIYIYTHANDKQAYCAPVWA